MSEKPEFVLTDEEKEQLLKIARQSLECHVRGEPLPDWGEVSANLATPCGAFVTLHKQGNLRGCIGQIQALGPLYLTVAEMAGAAALRDPRFPPVQPSELDGIDLEISVLSPFREIQDVEEIEVGVHGLLLRKGPYRGLLLPQVATEQGWDREEFLQHTCYKAGLPADAWREGATIEVFSAQVFGEEER